MNEQVPIKKLDSVDRNQLMWKQTAWGARDFELWSNEDLVAVLYWPKLLSDRAVAECAVGRWYVDRPGFFRRRTVVTEAESGVEVASFEAGWLGDGDLVLADGRVFHWFKTKAFRNFWALTGQDDALLIEIHAGLNWFKYEADVLLQRGAESLPELCLLIAATWYLGYMYIQDSAAAAAATAGAMA